MPKLSRNPDRPPFEVLRTTEAITRVPMRYRVMRAGVQGSYLAGWYVFAPFHPDDTGVFVSTWDEAMALANLGAQRGLRELRRTVTLENLRRVGLAVDQLGG